MRRFFSIIAIFALMSTSFAVNPLKIFVARSKTVKGDYVDVESLKVNHAYIETLDAHSPIHVVAPLYLYYGARDSASYISWFVAHHEDTYATYWGDTVDADTTDSVCIGDSILGKVFYWGCNPACQESAVTTNNGYKVDTVRFDYARDSFECYCEDNEGKDCYVLGGESGSSMLSAPTYDDTVFLYHCVDEGCSAVDDSFVVISAYNAVTRNYYWYLLCDGECKHWKDMKHKCIEITDTLYQIFGNDTFYLREKRNY